MMSKTQLPHIAEDALELYVMGRLSEPETEVVEEHLLVCHQCQDLLEETEEFVKAIRVAARELENEPEAQPQVQLRPEPKAEPWWRRLFAIPTPMIAAAACAMLAFFVLIPREKPNAVVDLRAMRGAEAAAVAPPNASLTMNLSLTGVESQGSLRVEVADAEGNIVRKADVDRKGEQATAHTDGLKAGTYWVRLYSGDELLREYGLTVQ